MSLTKKRWLVLLFACLANLCLGSVYAWSVFAGPMAEHLNMLNGTALTTADLSIVYTVANSIGPITMISGGFFNDKFGPRKVLIIGGTMFGAGMILASFSNSVTMLILTYGIITGLGLGMAYGCTISCCVKFFPDKRGLIGGLTTAAYGLSSVILPPVVTGIVAGAGVTSAFLIVGIVFLIVIIIASFFIFKCPDGFVPEGWNPPAVKKNESAVVDKKWNEMLKTPVFYIMIITMLMGAFSGMMVISQASAVGRELMGFDISFAALAVSVLALFNAFGRIIAGSLSDKIGRINTLAIACILSIVGNILLYISAPGTEAIFFIGFAVIGISFGSFMGVYPGFTADRFGAKNNSVNYGIMFIGFALAGLVGPLIMKNIYYADGTYTRSFFVAALFSAVGLVLTFVYRVVVRKKA